MEKLLRTEKEKKPFLFGFLFLVFGYILLSWLNNKFVLTSELYYFSLSNSISRENINELFILKTRWEWVNFIFTPVFLILKAFFISIVLYVGIILFEHKTKFSKLFKIAITAEYVFLFSGVIKFCWIYFFRTSIDLNYFGFFQPLSAINFFAPSDNLSFLIYPLQLINLFELAYFVILANLLMSVINKSFWESFEFVLSTYGLSLVIWVVFITFLTLNFGV
ncbi:MAG: hypothetical protein JW857_06110 [Bacteroidales bacterium]|nr:hypothetical protein [Bacteroidales bacterium]